MDWIATVRSASTAASSEPVSEISGDDFSDGNVIVRDFQVHESIGVTTVMADMAMLAPSMAMPSMDTAYGHIRHKTFL